ATPPAQPDDARCDSSLDAAKSLSAASSGACSGIMPAAPTCTRDFKTCTGTLEGPSGPGGTRTSFSASDGNGDLLLACAWVDTPLTGVSLYSAGNSGFVQGAQVGPDSSAVPLQSGFTLVPLGLHDKFALVDGSGAVLAATEDPPNLTLAGTDGAQAFWLTSDGQTLTIAAERFGPDGAVRSARQTLTASSLDGAITSIAGGAMDVNGHTLLLVSVSGDSLEQGIWLGPGGALETAFFSSAGVESAAALPGGGVVLGQAFPTQWHAVLATASTQPSSAPAWLATRGDFQIIRGGKALLFGSEIVTPDGTSCGTLSQTGTAGLDGTFITQSADATTFHVYPGLLR
ncbi:MAG TPA: hypothetical protein VH083_21000, partial [Myxococcales bacterium]|nr:hypothetical protein [Myxococcales bacterium]